MDNRSLQPLLELRLNYRLQRPLQSAMAGRGSLSGIGFGFMENVVYALAVLGHGVNVSLTLFLMRGLLTAPLHGITATLTGFGIGLWQKSENARLLVIPLIAAMVIHGSFNLLASII